MIATHLTDKGMQWHDVKGNLSGIVAFTLQMYVNVLWNHEWKQGHMSTSENCVAREKNNRL